MGQSKFEKRAVFISSTFRDMQAERDMIRDVVLTELADYADSKLIDIGFVDLRWGISTVGIKNQEEKERLVLKVCLDRIDETRPFMIVLLGDRYGWVPDRDLLDAVSAEKHYHPKNAKSVTALEIEYALLSDKKFMSHCFFYFREPLPYSEMDNELKVIYNDAYNNPLSMKLLENLKTEIRKKYPDKVRTYSTDWDGQSNRVVDFGGLSEYILTDLKGAIDEEVKLNPVLIASQKQLYDVESFFEKKQKGFEGRAEILDTLKSFAQYEDGIICLLGDVGSGKSAIMAKLYAILTNECDSIHQPLVLPFASGISPNCMDPTDMLGMWIDLLNDEYEKQHGERYCTPSDKNAFSQLVDWLEQLTFLCSENRRIVLMIDAIDQFGVNSRSVNLDYLPVALPNNVAIVISCLPGDWLVELHGRNAKELCINELSSDEVGKIISRYFAQEGKTHTSKAMTDAIVTKPHSHNPLLLSAYIQQLLILDEDDFSEASKQFKNLPEDEINERLVLQTIENCTEIPEQIYPELIRKACKRIDPQTLELCLGLIAYSAFGLRDSDIERAFNLRGIPFTYADFYFIIKRFKQQFRQDINKAWNLQHNFVIKSIQNYYNLVSEQLYMLLSDIFMHPNMDNAFELRNAFEYFVKVEKINELENLLFCSAELNNGSLSILIKYAQQLAAENETQTFILQMIVTLYGRHKFDEEQRLLPFITEFLRGIETMLDSETLKNFLIQLDAVYRIDGFINIIDMRVAQYLSVRAEIEAFFQNYNMAKNIAQFTVTIGERVFCNNYFPIVYKTPFDMQFGMIYADIRLKRDRIRGILEPAIGSERVAELFNMNQEQISQMKQQLLEIDQLIMSYAKNLLSYYKSSGTPQKTIYNSDNYDFGFMMTQSSSESDDDRYLQIMRYRLGLCCVLCEAAFESEHITADPHNVNIENIYNNLSRWEEFLAWQNEIDDPEISRLLGKLYSMGAIVFQKKGLTEKALSALQNSSMCYEKLYRISSGMEQLHQLIKSRLSLASILNKINLTDDFEKCRNKTLPYIQLLQRRYATHNETTSLIKQVKQIFNFEKE